MNRSLVFTALIGLLAAALSAAAQAQGTMAGANGLSASDRAFVVMAGKNNNSEIQAGRYAQSHAASRAVRMLGKHLADDHLANEQQLKTLALREGLQLPPPTATLPMAQATMAQLKTLSGRAFDATFLRAQEKGHQMGIVAYKHELATTTNPMLRAYVQQSLPVLDEHLLLATDDATHRHMAAGGKMSGQSACHMTNANGMTPGNGAATNTSSGTMTSTGSSNVSSGANGTVTNPTLNTPMPHGMMPNSTPTPSH